MPRIRVSFFSLLRRAAGTEAVDFEAADLRQLLAAVCRRFGPAFTALVLEKPGRPAEEARLRGDCNVLVNGRNVHFLAGLDTPLQEGDEVIFIPPAAGGD